jgi:hypothetical protein
MRREDWQAVMTRVRFVLVLKKCIVMGACVQAKQVFSSELQNKNP